MISFIEWRFAPIIKAIYTKGYVLTPNIGMRVCGTWKAEEARVSIVSKCLILVCLRPRFHGLNDLFVVPWKHLKESLFQEALLDAFLRFNIWNFLSSRRFNATSSNKRRPLRILYNINRSKISLFQNSWKIALVLACCENTNVLIWRWKSLYVNKITGTVN